MIKHLPYAMFLTHLVEKYPAYADFARNFGGYKILDNSLIELQGSVSLERIIMAARVIGADEIILPDVFQDCSNTLGAVQAALNRLKRMYGELENVPYKLMAVAQGCNEVEWARCYHTLNNIPRIDCIGIPKVCATMHPAGRPGFEEYWIPEPRKEIHLLGLWYSFTELSQYRRPELIRGCDSCSWAYMHIHGMGDNCVRPDGYTVDLEKDCIPDEGEVCGRNV
jgi:hypothetical protein